jgi:uncharacterized protein (TIGR01777 family)
MPKILITGTGFISKHLSNKLIKDGNEVVFLSTTKKEYPYFYWNPSKSEIDENALNDVEVIFHLAGANIADKPWTVSRKKEILESRVSSAKLLLKTLQKRQQKIKNFISASAVGFYGAVTSDKVFDESTPPQKNDFLSTTCQQWEDAANEFYTNNISENVSIHRFGIVFDKKEGAFPKLLLSYYFKTGIILGNGNQWIPWVGVDDVVNQLIFAMNNHLNGMFNCVTNVKSQVTYKQLSDIFSKKFKPFFKFYVPPFILNFTLGERSIMLLEGTRISNEKIKKLGFEYKITDVNYFL